MIELRSPCKECGHTTGYIETRNGQDTVWCHQCTTYQYNAPRVETGRAKRSLSHRTGLTPSQWARLLDAHGHTCISCGAQAPDVELQAGHLISRKAANTAGLIDDPLIDSWHNLAPMCATCNSGIGENPVSIRLMHRALTIKATWENTR